MRDPDYALKYSQIGLPDLARYMVFATSPLKPEAVADESSLNTYETPQVPGPPTDEHQPQQRPAAVGRQCRRHEVVGAVVPTGRGLVFIESEEVPAPPGYSEHYGRQVTPIVSPRVCRPCHITETDEFTRSNHAKAYHCVDTNGPDPDKRCRTPSAESNWSCAQLFIRYIEGNVDGPGAPAAAANDNICDKNKEVRELARALSEEFCKVLSDPTYGGAWRAGKGAGGPAARRRR